MSDKFVTPSLQKYLCQIQAKNIRFNIFLQKLDLYDKCDHFPDVCWKAWFRKPRGLLPHASLVASCHEYGTSKTHRIFRPRKTFVSLTPGNLSSPYFISNVQSLKLRPSILVECTRFHFMTKGFIIYEVPENQVKDMGRWLIDH